MAEMKSKPLRILALHGYYQSDVVFSAKLGSLRKGFKKQMEFTFLRAPHKARRPGGEEIGEEYGWWFNNTNSQFNSKVTSAEAVGFQESVHSVEKIFEEKGPFDGILGFSQGAAFAAILFNFAILISGFKSRCESHSVFYNDHLSIPSLHVYGTTDNIIPTEMTEDVTVLFDNATKQIHDGGHYVPGKKEIYTDFIQKMLIMKAESSW